MSQVLKYKQAMALLKELNCPQHIMEALEIWGMFVHDDEVKLHNWQALADGKMVEGECVEVSLPGGCSSENPCCDRRGEYNGFGSGPLKFVCPKHCPCHD